MRNNHIEIPGQPQRPAPMILAQPINDIQIVGLIAAGLPTGAAKERVGVAVDILEEVMSRQFDTARRLNAANEQSVARFNAEMLAEREAQEAKQGAKEEPKGILIAP